MATITPHYRVLKIPFAPLKCVVLYGTMPAYTDQIYKVTVSGRYMFNNDDPLVFWRVVGDVGGHSLVLSKVTRTDSDITLEFKAYDASGTELADGSTALQGARLNLMILGG